ncbi:MAG: hypothetical protein KGD59_07710 [Candidatus Heimdallarchaeota archaeon]|nr:hypothetical protein [Candidatus Heimdallarchaeota archaeon]MBY8994421.1 hypothetical protein [Candidatus Heimdallarchaeota archaeon]
MPSPQDTSMGTLSLIFGILGCVQILPCIGPIIALITGYSAKGTAGESNGRIGRILGWLMLCLPLIAVAIYVIVILAIGGVWFWQAWWP